MTQGNEDRAKGARHRLDPDDPSRDLLDNPREVARRRLERRLEARGRSEQRPAARGRLERRSAAHERSEQRPAARRHPKQRSAVRGRPEQRSAVPRTKLQGDFSTEEELSFASFGEETDGQLFTDRFDWADSDNSNGSHQSKPSPRHSHIKARSRRRSRRQMTSDMGSHSASQDESISASLARKNFFLRLSRSTLTVPIVMLLLLLPVAAGFAAYLSLDEHEANTPAEAGQATGASSVEDAQEEIKTEQADMTLLPDEVDSDLAESLESLAASDGRVAHIINTITSVLPDDEATKLLKLAANEPESIDFLVNIADNYPQETGEAYDEEVQKGTVPLFMQWDARWGYTEYCAMTFAAAGCAPTSLSMVYMGLTGNTDMTPYDMGVLASERGYAIDYEGTVRTFFVDIASELGLSCKQFSLDSATLKWYLENDFVVVCNVGPGDFTISGHFLVITGINDDGELTINDPYSVVRSAQTWDVDRVLSQSTAMYAFSEA